MPLKLFRATVANTDTESLMSLHTLFDTYLEYMLTKFVANRMVRSVQNMELFDKKPSFQKTFLKNIDAILQDVSVSETIV